MPYRKAARVVDLRDVEDEEDAALVMRDYVMARGAAALASLERAKEDVVQAMVLFITPDEDRKGKERRECLDNAIEEASIATRALEDAVDKFGDADLVTGEPWEEVDDDPKGAD